MVAAQKKRWAPEYEASESDRATVEAMAGAGIAQDTIARCNGDDGIDGRCASISAANSTPAPTRATCTHHVSAPVQKSPSLTRCDAGRSSAEEGHQTVANALCSQGIVGGDAEW